MKCRCTVCPLPFRCRIPERADLVTFQQFGRDAVLLPIHQFGKREFLFPELVGLDGLFGCFFGFVRYCPIVCCCRNGYRSSCHQSQSQIPVDNLQYLHEVSRTVAIQSLQLPHKEKAVAAVIVVTEVLHLVHTAMAVEVDVARCFLIQIKRIKKIPTNAPVAG